MDLMASQEYRLVAQTTTPTAPVTRHYHDLVCWGSTEFGQDGHGLSDHQHHRHKEKEGTVVVVPFHKGLFQYDDDDDVSGGGGVCLPQGTIRLAACGSRHSVVVTDSDEVYAWGDGSSGQIASPDMFTHRTPIKVTLDPPIPDNVTISQVSCGKRHSMLLLTNGQIYAFGNNSYGQLGYGFKSGNHKDNQVKPLLLMNVLPKPVTQVSCGDKHSVFLFEDGSLASVGNNSHGQLGDGTRTQSTVPTPVDLDCSVTGIASGNKHTLAISGAGDVYVWGYGKGCGHRRNDVLRPEVKLLGHDVLQVAGGRSHSLALTNSGDVYVWGFGTDGQLGLGDRLVTSSVPRLLRHRSVRGCVSQISCGESFSAAVAREGLLYMWGRNSHCIQPSEPNTKPYHQPVCVNHPASRRRQSKGSDRQQHQHVTSSPDDDDNDIITSRLSSVHSVQCGSCHALVLLGKPDWIPVKDENDEDSESDDEDDNIDDDGMTSEGSESTRSSIDDENLKNNGDTGDGGYISPEVGDMEPNPNPPRYTGVNKATSPPHASIDNHHNQPSLPPLLPSRGQTKLTLGEFYALTDSSPSESKNTTPKSSPRPSTNASPTKHSTSSSPLSPRKEQQQQQQHHHHSHHRHHNHQQQQQQHHKTKHNSVLEASKHPVEDKENFIDDDSHTDPRQGNPNTITPMCPIVHISSPTLSPDFSVISESSLKKRMADNMELNKGVQFKTRDWSGNKRGNRISPLRPLDVRVTPSPEHEASSPQGRLTPRASCRSKAASLTERAHTMFISKSTADHFILPREYTMISKQSVSLMDLGNLRSGAVFENNDNNKNNEDSASSSRNTSAGHFHSNASSRLSMASPYNENDLREIILQKSPDKRKLDAINSFISSSDTPSNMMRYNRMKDMSGLDQNGDSPLRPNHVLFATPSPGFGTNNTGNGDFKNNTEMPRPRALYGHPRHKHYRKPGLPGVDVKTKVARPGQLQGPSLYGTEGSLGQNGKQKDNKLSELSMHRTLTTLELTPPSIKHHVTMSNGNNSQLTNATNNTDHHPHHDLDPSDLGGYIPPSQPFINLTPRRTANPTGSLWRARTITQNPSVRPLPADLSMDLPAFKAEGVGGATSLRKDNPFSTRPFHNKPSGGSNTGVGGTSRLVKMKKNIFFEKAQTSLAISGAGTPGPKGQYIRQVNTSACSRNHRKM